MKPPYWVPIAFSAVAVVGYVIDAPFAIMLAAIAASWALFLGIRCIEKLTR